MKAQEVLAKLTLCLGKLPGVGRRSAERMALSLFRDRETAGELASLLKTAEESVASCERCGGLTSRSENPCRLCSDKTRDGKVICVVEDAGDIMAIERAGAYRGRYHALAGKEAWSGQAGLRLESLVRRVAEERFEEVVLATGTDVQGDATASCVREALRGSGVKISRIAFGLPAGSAIAYSDPVTIVRAIRGRTVEG